MSNPDINTIAVLGAGTMGNGIAHVFARGGYDVILRDVDERALERALATIAMNLEREIKKGKLAESDKPAILARVKPATDAAALVSADFAVEAVPEQFDLKARVLK